MESTTNNNRPHPSIILQTNERTNKDPYLKVKLHGVAGRGATVSLRDKHLDATLNPDLFQSFPDLSMQVPGPAKLEVQVWDYDLFTGDDHIGSTFIDLEDRWFSPRFRANAFARSPSAASPSAASFSATASGPVEVRQLWSSQSLFPQGSLSLFVDIAPTSAARMGKMPRWKVRLLD